MTGKLVHKARENSVRLDGRDIVQFDLTTHTDARGGLTEVFRSSWSASAQIAKLDIERLGANAVRGLWCYEHSAVWLALMAGRITVGLHDAREDSTAAERSTMLTLGPVAGLWLPPGVVFGYCCLEDALVMTGLATLPGCAPDSEPRRYRWNDPALGLNWPELESAQCGTANASQCREEGEC
ncbi:dTDP-4-dehydrorhamnose 3,5-epimerase family protein [Pseudomarimonas arenosa]|uniref:dTDP-4-dehydrorhamnose 3,5-epimerase n=1 Tax=Pseudomarimonas arenosa TaxID=2774145 RepID=A0AAW3ZIQ3_9GAMM|nr:dTDP-4-dehydrorhamnose 3,5-epimerase family protein [Pseudomarimonas arenosa]MBD8524882.1 dTDP-4-dehydrorhamnose 3,5-epimerase family protein [Pseudomarimonas arenosa]